MKRSVSDERTTLLAGCLMTLVSASITGLLLFLNGSLVMALLTAFSASGPSWAKKPAFSQFVLFSLPVALVVIQWMMIDYLRTRFRSRATD